MKYQAIRKCYYQLTNGSGVSEGPCGPYRDTKEEAQADFTTLSPAEPCKHATRVTNADEVRFTRVRSFQIDELSLNKIRDYIDDINVEDLKNYSKKVENFWSLRNKDGIKTVGDLRKHTWKEVANPKGSPYPEYADTRLQADITRAVALRIGLKILNGLLKDRLFDNMEPDTWFE